MKSKIFNVLAALTFVLVVQGHVNATVHPYSGEYMFTMEGSDWNGSIKGANATLLANLEANMESWFLTEKGITRDFGLEWYAKVEAANSGSVTTGNLTVNFDGARYYGTWSTSDPVEFYTVKGGQEFAMYWLGSAGMNSGSWTTEHLTPNNQIEYPEISHLSAYNPVQAVPEPATMLLFGTGVDYQKR